ncbi:MAG: type II secretion system protein [Clostridia bacterium]|nr:type II secretion system protein [Clostridia bacterium]
MLKQNKGITLVALVITIIVLLILAGVSISLVVGDNGVLTRASDSSAKTKYSQAKEALGLAINNLQTEYFNAYTNNASAKIEDYVYASALDTELKKQGYRLFTSETAAKDADGAAAPAKGTKFAGTETFYIKEDAETNDYVEVKIKIAGTVGVDAHFGTKLNAKDASGF